MSGKTDQVQTSGPIVEPPSLPALLQEMKARQGDQAVWFGCWGGDEVGIVIVALDAPACRAVGPALLALSREMGDAPLERFLAPPEASVRRWFEWLATIDRQWGWLRVGAEGFVWFCRSEAHCRKALKVLEVCL